MEEELFKFIKKYCDENTINTHKYFNYYTWLDKNKEEVIGFISFFPLEDREYDVVISHNKDNKYSKPHWRTLITLLKDRSRTIIIDSDSNNKVLQRICSSNGGYFNGDTMIYKGTYKGKEK